MEEALKNRLRMASLLSLSMVLSLGLALWCNLERPFWAGFTAMALSLATVGQSFQKALLRVGGTVAGALAALLIMAAVPQEHLLLLGLLFCFLCLMAMQTLRSRYNSYLYYTSALTATVISIGSISSELSPFLFALTRLEETGLGILVCSVLALLWNWRSAVGDFYAGVDKFLAAYTAFFTAWIPSWAQASGELGPQGEAGTGSGQGKWPLSGADAPSRLMQEESREPEGKADPAQLLEGFMHALSLLDKAQALLPAARLENYAVRRHAAQWEAFFQDSRESLQSLHTLVSLEQKLPKDCLISLLPNLPDAWRALRRAFTCLADATLSLEDVMPEALPRLQVETSLLQQKGQLLQHRVRRFSQEWEQQREACLLLFRSRSLLAGQEFSAGSVREAEGRTASASVHAAKAEELLAGQNSVTPEEGGWGACLRVWVAGLWSAGTASAPAAQTSEVGTCMPAVEGTGEKALTSLKVAGQEKRSQDSQETVLSGGVPVPAGQEGSFGEPSRQALPGSLLMPDVFARHRREAGAVQPLFTLKQRAFLLRCTTLYWGAVYLWLYANPPGTLQVSFVEMSIVIGLVGLLSGDLPPMQVLASFAGGCVVAFGLYFGLLPLLHSFLPLALVLLLYFFVMGWCYYLPADGLRRNGMLIPVLALSGLSNEHVYAPERFFTGTLSMMLCAALVALVYYLFSGAGLPHRFVRRQQRLCSGVRTLLEEDRTGSMSGRWWLRWRIRVLQELAQAQLELAFQLNETAVRGQTAALKLTALNTCSLLRHMAANLAATGTTAGGGLPLNPVAQDRAAGDAREANAGTEMCSVSRWRRLWQRLGNVFAWLYAVFRMFLKGGGELRLELDRLRMLADQLEARLPLLPATGRRLALLEVLQSLHTLLESAAAVDWRRVNRRRF